MDRIPKIEHTCFFCYREVLNIANNRQDLPIIEVSHMPNMRFLSLNPLKCPKNSLVYTWPLVAAGQV